MCSLSSKIRKRIQPRRQRCLLSTLAEMLSAETFRAKHQLRRRLMHGQSLEPRLLLSADLAYGPQRLQLSDISLETNEVRLIQPSVDLDQFRFEIPTNASAADTTNTDQLQPGGSSGLNLTGAGLTAGVWEAGSGWARTTHNEFGGRVSIGDTGGSTASHATHVTGTIAGSGSGDATARGMATAANVISYTSSNASAEMRAASAADQIQVSNHSYSLISGWWVGDVDRFGLTGGTTDVWWGDRFLQSTEDADFGKYSSTSRDLDSVLSDHPDLLSVWSAGNDRNDVFTNRRSNDTYVTFLSGDPGNVSGYGGSGWYLVNNFGNTAAPGQDGNGGSGFDSLSPAQVAKNSLVVGSVLDVTADPYNLTDITTSSFSSYGPTDDGRIKPDVVGNGQSLRSSESSGDFAYGNKSGTSMSAPNVAGSSLLLIEHFEDEFGFRPTSATTKGLLIHTASDAGNVGPDFAHGWGLVDSAAAANHLTSSAADDNGRSVDELDYSGSNTSQTVTVDGSQPLKVTLVWTDPEGTAHSSGTLDQNNPALVNDLDLSITDSSGATFHPWTLDPGNPSSPAIRTAANHVDNVEQVLIDAPTAGQFTIHVKHTGNVTDQPYSLLISGGTTAAPTEPLRFLAGTGSGHPSPFHLVELQTSPASEVTIGPASYNVSMDVDPTTGLLYGASSSLRTIDEQTGAATVVGSIDTATQSGILVRSIAFSPDGTLYAVGPDETATTSLFTLDKSTGAATRIGALAAPTWGIDFSPDGTLYGAFGGLQTIAPETGAIISNIGSLGTFVLDIDFAADGTIYAITNENNRMVSIDPSTAAVVTEGLYSDGLWGIATVPGDVIETGELSGSKWNDANGDGERDPGESGIEGWTIFIDENGNGILDEDEASTITDQNGDYSFTGLAEGDYVIAEVQQAGWNQTSPTPPPPSVAQDPDVSFDYRSNAADVAGAADGIRSDTQADASGEDHPDLAESASLINMDLFRADPRFASIDGSGFSVAVLDSGIDLDHPFFGPDGDFDGTADRIVFNQDFSNEGKFDADDVDGHGTNVSGIIAGVDANGADDGIAPGAEIVALQVLDDGGGFPNLTPVENGLQWVIANAETYNIAAVNLSLGTFNNYSNPTDLGLGDEFATLRAMNIVIVSSAGNDFSPSNSQQNLGYPAADPLSLSISAVWDGNNGTRNWNNGATDFSSDTDRIISFSQRSATMSDIFAPGGGITSAGVGGGLSTYYGTSQAAPQISGIALLAQQIATERIGRRLTPDEFRTLMRDTAVTINDGDDEDVNVTSTGLDFLRVDAFALAEAIWSMGGGATPGDGVWNVTLTAGDSFTGLDFGNQQVSGDAQIDGIKFEDLDGNGTQDPGEPGLPGWTIFLDDNANGLLDSGERSTVTGPDGKYQFIDLPAGQYVVAEIQKSGWEQTSPINDIQPLAIETGIGPDGASFRYDGVIGDHPSLPAGLDVDMFSIELAAGEQLLVDIDAAENGSTLDSVITLFDIAGTHLAVNDDAPSNGESETSDSFLQFVAPADGTYFIAVSAYGNFEFDPLTPGLGFPSKLTGPYSIEIQRKTLVNTPDFHIDVVFVDSNLTPTQQGLFTTAAARWSEIIIADLPDVGLIDDLEIEASAPAIDGPGLILGQAGPTDFRSGSSLPYRGIMQFDSADVSSLELSGRLEDVILHEMGHVLGLGTLWQTLGLLDDSDPSDPRFTGTAATVEYNDLFGFGETSVPVENDGGEGTALSHWEENDLRNGAPVSFNNELMTGFLNSGSTNPISRVTIAQFQDLGYTVDVNAADAFSPSIAGISAGQDVENASSILALQPDQARSERVSQSFFRATQASAESAGHTSASYPHLANAIRQSSPVQNLRSDLGGPATASTLNTPDAIETLINGDFELGDLSGWTMTDSTGNGSWSINDGTLDPSGPKSPTSPISGQYDALSQQSASGTRSLQQTFVVPESNLLVLAWQDRIENSAASFENPNQEFRVLLKDSSQNLIQEIYRTLPGDVTTQTGPNDRQVDLTTTLSSFHGQTVTLSFEQQDDLGYFNVTLDNISLLAEAPLLAADLQPGDGVWHAQLGAGDQIQGADFGNRLRTDNGFTLRETDGGTEVDESSGSDSFSVVLDQPPVSNVVISINSSDPGEAQTDLQELVFHLGNWNQPQVVTVSGVQDSTVDGDQISTLTMSIVEGRSDDAFDNYADQTLSVTTHDVDGDQAPPRVLSFTRFTPLGLFTADDALTFHVTFDEPVSGVATSAFEIAGDSSAIVQNVAAVQGTGDIVFQITVSGGDLADFNGEIGLNLSNAQGIADLAGNPLPRIEPQTDQIYILDNIAPQLSQFDFGDGSASVVRSLSIDFDSEVHFLPGAFQLQNQAGAAVDIDHTQALVEGKTHSTLVFSGPLVDPSGSLIDGDYLLTILNTHVRDSAGNSYDGDANGIAGGDSHDEFFRLLGDLDSDRDVDALDLRHFATAFRSSNSDEAYRTDFDFDLDGDVDVADLGRLRRNHLKSLD